ncbi:hypothetical protein EON63_18875 [archaeon]|nr:MAG: hypothetical protein EON63_18875 [archaeon]
MARACSSCLYTKLPTPPGAVYDLINPLVGAARADVWRYAVLYTYGGVYLDDDSDMKTPFDDVRYCMHGLCMYGCICV